MGTDDLEDFEAEIALLRAERELPTDLRAGAASTSDELSTTSP